MYIIYLSHYAAHHVSCHEDIQQKKTDAPRCALLCYIELHM